MRRILVPIVLAAALVGVTAPAASAESCYGAQNVAVACFEGSVATLGEAPVGTCLYTGGSTCTPYYVEVPWVSVGDLNVTRLCATYYCFTNEELGQFVQAVYCRVNPEPYYCNS